MTVNNIKTSANLPTATKDTLFVYGVKKSGTKLALVSAEGSQLIKLPLESIGASTSEDALCLTHFDGKVVGLVGFTAELNNLRAIGGTIGRNISGFKQIVVVLPLQSKAEALAIAEGILLGDYSFDLYKPKKSTTNASVTLVTKTKLAASEISSLKAVIANVQITRDLVNTAPNDLYPQALASAVQKSIKGLPIKMTVWDEKKLAADGFGGISAVGRGSVRPPRMVKIEYKPKGAKKHVAFVGKGITFDTGGLSIKPATGMIGMKYDMAGAATVFAAVKAIAELKLNVHATAWLCIAENMPSGSATRPNDVIKIRNGKTVEVTNTDAEGRLVLADGISAASETYPDLIIDVATLTGAARVALGNRYAGLMGADDAVKQVQKAAASAGELVWHMPLAEELSQLLKSDVADMINSKLGNPAGGMLVGGLFLQEFVGNQKGTDKPIHWAHLDIASGANNDLAPYGYTPKGATGAFVRTLVELAKSLA